MLLTKHLLGGHYYNEYVFQYKDVTTQISLQVV